MDVGVAGGHGQIGLGLLRPLAERGDHDVAATLAAVLRTGTTSGKGFDLLAGDTPVEEAVRTL